MTRGVRHCLVLQAGGELDLPLCPHAANPFRTMEGTTMRLSRFTEPTTESIKHRATGFYRASSHECGFIGRRLVFLSSPSLCFDIWLSSLTTSLLSEVASRELRQRPRYVRLILASFIHPDVSFLQTTRMTMMTIRYLHRCLAGSPCSQDLDHPTPPTQFLPGRPR
jgi:hypothetical protein